MSSGHPWRNGPHAEAVYALRTALCEHEDRARRIDAALAAVEKLWGPAGVERLTDGDPKKGAAWAEEHRIAAKALRATIALLTSPPEDMPHE